MAISASINANNSHCVHVELEKWPGNPNNEFKPVLRLGAGNRGHERSRAGRYVPSRPTAWYWISFPCLRKGLVWSHKRTGIEGNAKIYFGGCLGLFVISGYHGRV